MSEVRCPKCAHPVPHLAEFVGKEAVCLSCGAHFKIPSLGPGPSAKSASYKVVWISSEMAPNESPPARAPSSGKPQL